jgi:hypothetical protein
VPDGTVERPRGWRFPGRGDLAPVPRVPVSDELWADHERAIALLRAWAEDRATETISWYLRDKQAKRWGSRLLRASAVLTAVAGGALPLLAGTVGGINSNLGYVFLAVAAGCIAFDHYFGLSSGWMRDIAAIQALQGTVARFQLDWSRWQATRAGATGNGVMVTDADNVDSALELIEALVTRVAQITEAETNQWITDFSSSVAALRQQTSPSVSSAQDLLTWGSQGNLNSAD